MITKTLSTMKMNMTSPTSAVQQTAGRLLTLTAKTRKTSQASIQLAFGKFGLEISLIHSLTVPLLTFRDFLLKPELLRAISDLGFEHPSEGWFFSSIDDRSLFMSFLVQQECIPQAV